MANGGELRGSIAAWLWPSIQPMSQIGRAFSIHAKGVLMFTIPGAMAFADLSLLFLRVMLALVFGTSGYSHLTKPKERAASIGMSVPFTIFLGAAELAGSIALVTGFMAQWAAIALILIMLGAIGMKAFKWRTGFWGEKSMGWHYDLLMIAMNLVILTLGPGKYSL